MWGPPDRAGLERLPRYCARPSVAIDRLKQGGADLVYRYCGVLAPNSPLHGMVNVWFVLIGVRVHGQSGRGTRECAIVETDFRQHTLSGAFEFSMP